MTTDKKMLTEKRAIANLTSVDAPMLVFLQHELQESASTVLRIGLKALYEKTLRNKMEKKKNNPI